MSEALFLRESLAADPIVQFDTWFEEAQQTVHEANAMTLATADRAGVPSARIVLLKGVDAQGFTFFTNYQSRKGRELTDNPHAALVFHWETKTTARQVRVVGGVAKVSAAESDSYFNSRAFLSRIGAWASNQDAVLPNRDQLEADVKMYEHKFADGNVPRPPHWGGFRVTPRTIEFWQGRHNRLHDRFLYTRAGDAWTIDRLSP